MNTDEDHGEIFLDESDIIQEFTVDEEGISPFVYNIHRMFLKLIILFANLFVASDLPDADEDAGSDDEVFGSSLKFENNIVCVHIMVSKNDYQVMIYTYPAELFSTRILVLSFIWYFVSLSQLFY